MLPLFFPVVAALLLFPPSCAGLISPLPSPLIGSTSGRILTYKQNVLLDSPRTSTALLMAAGTGGDPPASVLVSQGMRLFSSGDVDGSIELFDRADATVPDGSLRPFLWQRGLSYYYANRFPEGSEQFRLDVKVNPLDVEEIVWDIACQARLDPGGAFPPSNKMALPAGRTDRRKIMSTVYSLFRGDGATEHDLFAAGHDSSASDEFYSIFYLGLYCESIGETGKASNYMRTAASSRYATGLGSGDYMASCAKIHCKLRGWV